MEVPRDTQINQFISVHCSLYFGKKWNLNGRRVPSINHIYLSLIFVETCTYILTVVFKICFNESQVEGGRHHPHHLARSNHYSLHNQAVKQYQQTNTIKTMKLSVISVALLASGASAFAPSINARTSSTTSLNLFGGKKSGGDEGKGGPMGGMMDQLAMFKKAQEIAKKKNDLDKEIAQMDIIGSAADGKIKVTVQYVPAQLPANPSPGYDTTTIDIDEDYLSEVSCEDLGAALVDALRDGETAATKIVAEKYQSLDKELSGILGGMGAGAAPPAE